MRDYTDPTKCALENDLAEHQFFSRVATSASQRATREKNWCEARSFSQCTWSWVSVMPLHFLPYKQCTSTWFLRTNIANTLKYRINVPQVIRVPQQKSTLKTGQISWNNRSEDREIANYHSPIHCNSFTCQFKGFKVIFGGKSLRTTGNFGLELIRVPVRLFDTLEYYFLGRFLSSILCPL